MTHYKSNIILSIGANLCYALFSIFTLTLVVPFLSVLFGQIVPTPVRPEFTLSTRYAIDTFYYWMGLVIVRHGKYSALIFIATVVAIFSLLSNLFRYLSLFCLAPIRSGILKNLRGDIYHRLLILPLSFYSERRKGDIMSRMGADVQEVEWSIFSSLTNICRDPLIMAIFLFTLFSISGKLTVVVLIVLPIAGYLIALIGRSIKRYSLKSQTLLGHMSSLFEEAIGGLRVIKGYNAEEQSTQNFRNRNFQFYRLNKKIFRITESGSPLIEFLCIFALLVIVAVGAMLFPSLLDIDGALLVLYLIVFARLIPSAKSLVATVYTMQKGLSAAGRVYEIIDADEKIMECENPLPVTVLRDRIEYREVAFSYQKASECGCAALRNINFTLQRGQTIAIVGPSGGGKSTIVDLLPRFYDIEAGTILIDGIANNRYRISDLRSLFGIVNQDTILFNDTVYNNIVFGMPGATREQVVKAAEIAQAHRFIMEMDNGYETIIGDRGMRLSGGQRQRISIARAILRNPQILILDEATSALDTESEFLFQKALLPLIRERTAIIIAHRLGTIRFADNILFVKEGTITESGTHTELMNKKGDYYHFYESQK